MQRALTSASNLAQRETCPGSAYAESLFPAPPDEDSEYSKEGTLLHALDADKNADRSALKSEQAEVLDIAERGDEQIYRLVLKSLNLPEDEPYIEEREKALTFRKGIKALFPGHADSIRFYPGPKVMVVIDKKFGRREVTPAESNVQLRAYATMAATLYKADSILVAINQPRLPHDQRITMAEYRAEHIPAARDHLLEIWNVSHNPDGSPRQDAPRTADADAQCRYCSAKLQCDAYKSKYDMLADASTAGKDNYIARLQQLSDDELDRIYVATTFAALIKPEAKAEIIRRSQAGGMTAYTVGEPGKMPKIVDPVAAKRNLMAAGIPAESIDKCATYGIEKLTEVFKDRNGGTMLDAKKSVKQALGDALEINPKAPVITRIKGTPLPAPSTPAKLQSNPDQPDQPELL